MGGRLSFGDKRGLRPSMGEVMTTCEFPKPGGGMCFASGARAYRLKRGLALAAPMPGAITRCFLHAPEACYELDEDAPQDGPSSLRDPSPGRALPASLADEIGAMLGQGHEEMTEPWAPAIGSRAWMAVLMDDLFAECRAVREIAQKEYAHDEGNAFGNFDRVGEAEGLRPDQVLRVYFRKHIDGIVAHFNGLEQQREPIKGRFIDAITYLCLLYGLSERARILSPDPRKQARL